MKKAFLGYFRCRWMLLAGCVLMLTHAATAQTMRKESTGASTWLDFQRLAASHWEVNDLPSWIESVGKESLTRDKEVLETVFRVRLLELRQLKKEMQIRVFFDDQPNQLPKISGWSETGTQAFGFEARGEGLGLPTSETFTFSTDAVDFLEISIPGDGRGLRGIYLALLKTEVASQALDRSVGPVLVDPFDNLTPAKPEADDLVLYGRVRAKLDSATVKIEPARPWADWEFALESPPLTSLVSFDILGAETFAPPELLVNDVPLGAVGVHLPDLADPAYQGNVRALEPDMRFRYTGWLRCQKAIPGSALRNGENRITVRLHPNGEAVAIRAVEIQLKYNWKNLDYILHPPLP